MLQFQDDHVKVVHKNEKFGPEFSQILSRPNSCDKTSSAAGVDRLVSVSGSSDKIVEPDECSCKVKLCTNRSKETAAEARQSVLRREGYIKQILGSYGCYVSFLFSVFAGFFADVGEGGITKCTNTTQQE